MANPTESQASSRPRAASEARKEAIRRHADGHARKRRKWKRRAAYFHACDVKYMRFLIPEGKRILDLGCGPGDLLAALKPTVGIGVDISAEMVAVATEGYPDLTFIQGDVEDAQVVDAIPGAPFDFIILSDTIGVMEDCQATLARLHALCHRDTRIIVSYFSYFWGPILRLLEFLGCRMPQVEQNYIPAQDIRHFLALADFDVVKQERRILVPARLFGLGDLINRYVSFLPLIRQFNLRTYSVARSLRHAAMEPQSVSVIVPCRNERGNIEAAVRRLPAFGRELEVIFVEGHSSDGTFEEIERVAEAHGKTIPIRYARQDGIGKGDAMRKGYAMAKGEVLMILDADLTVGPEDLPKFYDAIVSGKGEFINGSRLVYPMEDDAMRLLNLAANAAFARIFSWLLNQRITDTLCGTKVLRRAHYDRIAEGRAYFGDFDPFGDFDLIFGAGKQNLRIIDMPIRYDSRRYGETQISRFRHGWLLLRMVVFAFRKLAAF